MPKLKIFHAIIYESISNHTLLKTIFYKIDRQEFFEFVGYLKFPHQRYKKWCLNNSLSLSFVQICSCLKLTRSSIMNNEALDILEANDNAATNIFLLDTSTVLSILVIVVFMIKLFNNVLASNSVGDLRRKRRSTGYPISNRIK